MVAYAKTVVVGDGADPATELGPIQNEPQYQKVGEYFTDCRANGYTFALGGEIDPHAEGWFIPVTIVDNPPEDSRLVAEEPFGPILPLLRWTDESDVIAPRPGYISLHSAGLGAASRRIRLFGKLPCARHSHFSSGCISRLRRRVISRR